MMNALNASDHQIEPEVSPERPANLSDHIAPIETLPNEVLTGILEAGRRLPRLSYNNIPIPILASHISRTFRHVAINNPSLWTNIFASCSASLGRVHAYLERSAQCPLDITFVLPSGSNHRWTLRDTETCMDMLIVHSSRWREFLLMSNDPDDTRTVMPLLGGLCTPNLRCMRLCPVRDEFGSVTLGNLLPAQAQLTTLELYFDPAKIFAYIYMRDVFRAFPSLATLILHGACIQLAQCAPDMVIELPSVRSLSIGIVNDCTDGWLSTMTVLSTPALQTLELWNFDEEQFHLYRESMEHRTSAKYPALKSLRLLEVRNDRCSDDMGVWLMKACPMITHLAINGPFAEILRIITGLPPSMAVDESAHLSAYPVWPKLSSLTLIGTDVRRISQMEELMLLNVMCSRPRMGLTELRMERRIVEYMNHRSVTHHKSIGKWLPDSVRLEQIETEDYHAYLSRITSPYLEEKVFGTSTFWQNSMDLYGG